MEQPFQPEEAMPPDANAYIDALRRALLGQESRGDFGVRGQTIQQGSPLVGERAMGGFQIMPSTARELMGEYQELANAVGDQDLEQALMGSPELQERFFAANLATNARRLGSVSPEALILAHYGGRGPARRYLQTGEMSDRPIMTTGQPNPSHRQYVDQVMGRLGAHEAPELQAFIEALRARMGGP